MPFDPYLNVEEIESAMELAANANPTICQLITLPNLTYEGRTCHLIKISAGSLTNSKGVMFLGGVHAREWGSSDILIALMENLIDAYNNNTGLTFQGKSFNSEEIQRIVETIDIFIYPNANPDGKEYSQSGHDWRKNRRPVTGGIGIDINRNYDFLWDANIYFDPFLSFGYLYNPSYETYHGPSPFSEVENQNIKWIVDNYPNIAYFIDIHSYGQKIMYVWGDDENQLTEPEQNFMNSLYDGKRGLSGDSYSEFMFSCDNIRILNIANRMHNALFAVRGKSYSVGQIFHQVGVASGTSASYMFSRFFSDSSKRKIYAFGIEWGTQFQPDPAEMLNIIDDISAALTEFCLCASETDLFIRDNLSDTGKEPSEGILSKSPDIITRKTQVADPSSEFNNVSVDPVSDNVEIGNDNYIYVRVHNNGSIQTNASVRVYYAPLNTSCSPALWQFIDEVEITAIPANGFKVSNAITWPNVPDPGTGSHFCIIAICSNTIDTIPDFSMIHSASDFMKYIKNCNNISYRNIVFEDIVADSWIRIPFFILGFSMKQEKYEIVIHEYQLPDNTRIELTIKPVLFFEFIFRKSLKYDVKSIDRNKRLIQPVIIKNIAIRKQRHRKAFINLKFPTGLKQKSNYNLSIVQKTGKLTVGQFTINFNLKN